MNNRHRGLLRNLRRVTRSSLNSINGHEAAQIVKKCNATYRCSFAWAPERLCSLKPQSTRALREPGFRFFSARSKKSGADPSRPDLTLALTRSNRPVFLWGRYGPAPEERGEQGSRRPPSTTIPAPKAVLRTGLCGTATFVVMPVRAWGNEPFSRLYYYNYNSPVRYTYELSLILKKNLR